jgi:hypothetical protein
VRVYLDAAPVIYLIQTIPPLAATVEAYIAGPGVEVVVSDLSGSSAG